MLQRIIFFVILFLASHLAQAQAKKPVAKGGGAKKTRILFLLDCSGSMLADMDGDTRMNVAKRMLGEIVDSLSTKPNLEMALRAYGHQSDRGDVDCYDSKLEVGFWPKNNIAIKDRLKVLKARGNTPISYSLEQCAKDYPKDPNADNIVILITDGLESCNRDPCAVAAALKSKNINLKPFVIGVGSDGDFKAAFSCIGQYFDAKSSSGFKSVLRKIVRQTLNKTTVTVNLLNASNQPKETNLNMTFYNALNGEVAYDLVHYLDAKGLTDTLAIDPSATYNLVINSLPAVEKKNIPINAGMHNTISVKVPQGGLSVAHAAGSGYGQNLTVMVRNGGKLLNVQPTNVQQQYLAGTYDVEVLTLPRTIMKNVNVAAGKTTTINVPGPGIVNITDNIPGYGGIYEVLEDGREVLIYNLIKGCRVSLPIQPGEYKVVYRSAKAQGSRYTSVKYFSIEATGSVADVTLF
jgi:Ca-activated chloride channel family protein